MVRSKVKAVEKALTETETIERQFFREAQELKDKVNEQFDKLFQGRKFFIKDTVSKNENCPVCDGDGSSYNKKGVAVGLCPGCSGKKTMALLEEVVVEFEVTGWKLDDDGTFEVDGFKTIKSTSSGQGSENFRVEDIEVYHLYVTQEECQKACDSSNERRRKALIEKLQKRT